MTTWAEMYAEHEQEQVEKHNARVVRETASHIKDQKQLDLLLKDCSLLEQEAMLDRLSPFLKFTPTRINLDCPECGTERGSITAHQCVED